MRHHRPLVPALASCAGLAVAVALLPFGSGAAASAPPAAARSGSDIALKAGAFGTRVAGGDVPTGSGMTAFSVIACTSRAGLERSNAVTEADLPSLGTVAGATTRNWTRKRGNKRHAHSRSAIAEVVLADGPLGELSIRGIRSKSHAWYDGRTFRSNTRSSIGRIVFTPPAGEPQEIDIPTPGQPVEVPGLATLTLGASKESAKRGGATAFAVALRVDLVATDTHVLLARSRAQAYPGAEHGTFNGYSAGTEAQVLGGVLTSGRNPVSYMPCQSTGGEVQKRANADVDLGGDVVASAVSSRQWSKRLKRRSKAWERGAVAGLTLGGGAVVVDAVVGKAKVVRKAGGKRSRKAITRIGSVTVQGEAQELPPGETLEIPGVATLESRLVTRLPAGLKVVALRVSLLDGSGAVLDLGVARTLIRK